MNANVGTTTITSAQALTANYALQENQLQAVYGTDKWFQLYGETQTTLDITYTTGAAETNNHVEFYIQYGSGAPSLISWADETMEYFDDSANQIVLEAWTYKIDGASAATSYTKRIQLPVCTKGIRIYAKEGGVAANHGTLTIKANVQAAGASSYNRSLQTVTLEGSAGTPADNTATPTTALLVENFNMVYDGATWDMMRGDSANGTLVNLGANNDIQGDIAHDAADSGNPVKLGGKASTSKPGAVSNADRVNAYFDEYGRLHTVDEGGSSVLPVTHRSPQDFSVAYTSNVTVTVSSAPFTVADANCFIAYIYYRPTGGNWQAPLVNGVNGVSITSAANVITVAGAGTPFAASDEYLVGIIYQEKGYDTTTDATKGFEVSPLDSHYTDYAIDVDTTNVGAGPTYYPSATGLLMDGAKHLSFTGSLLEGDAEDNTLTVEVMNDEDTTSGSWHQVYFFDNLTNAWVANYGCNATTTYLCASLDNLNFTRVRLKFVGGASATNTIIIKARTSNL